VTIDDIPIIIQVVLSTASLERSKIFDLLISNNGYLRTRDVIGLLNATAPTARRAMTELKAVGLVSLDDDVAMEEGEAG
jgi:Mn-dependent DtxR family transcriptional regulator